MTVTRATLAVRVLSTTRKSLEELAAISDMSMGAVIDGLVYNAEHEGLAVNPPQERRSQDSLKS